MPYPIGRQESYDSLRPYLPEDAKAILEKEIPRIRKQIDVEIDEFVKGLGSYIKLQAEAASKEIESEAKDSGVRMDKIISDLKAIGCDHAKLAGDLQRELDAYKAKWQKFGEAIQKAALTAAKAAGVPITF